MLKSKISTVEAIMLILNIVVIHSILSLPSNILNFQKSASILNLIYVGIIAIIISYIIFRLFKNFPGLDIIDICELVGGKILKNIVGSIFIVYFILTSSLLLRSFCESIKIIYYPTTYIIFIIALFIISLCISNKLDFSSTLKTNLIIIPFVLASIIFLFVSNMNKFMPHRIFPILGEGIFNTFVLGLGNLASFGGIAFIYFLPPLLKEPEKFKKITIYSISITAIYIILTVSTLLFMFSFLVNTNEISPLYTATTYIEFGNFFQRLESVFLLVWILSFACYLSIVNKFAMNIFKKLTNIETPKPLIDILGLLIFSISLLPKNLAITQNFESNVYPYLVITIVFFISLTILVLANLQKHKTKNLLTQK